MTFSMGLDVIDIIFNHEYTKTSQDKKQNFNLLRQNWSKVFHEGRYTMVDIAFLLPLAELPLFFFI